MSILLENIKSITQIIPSESVQFKKDLITITIKGCLLKCTLLILKNHVSCQFKNLSGIYAVGYSKNPYRFQIVYDLLSTRYNKRICVKIQVTELVLVDSCEMLYSNAIIYEDKILTITGFFFKSLTNVNRLLTCYGFPGYTAKKGIPLGGYIKMRNKKNHWRIIEAFKEFCHKR